MKSGANNETDRRERTVLMDVFGGDDEMINRDESGGQQSPVPPTLTLYSYNYPEWQSHVHSLTIDQLLSQVIAHDEVCPSGFTAQAQPPVSVAVFDRGTSH